MFEIEQLPMDAARAPVLHCHRLPSVCIRLIDATTRAGIPGLPVRLGNAHDRAAQDFFLEKGGDPLEVRTFHLDHETYTVYAQGRTDQDGWVSFPCLALARPAKGDLLVFSGYALEILAPHYRALEPQGEAGATPRKGGPAAIFPLSPDKNTVILATLRSEDPYLPPDFAPTIDGLTRRVRKIRIAAEQGANLGNQSAVLSLLTNLRRVGYTKPIEVLTSPDPLPYEDQRRFTFTLMPPQERTPQSAVEAAFARVKAVLGGVVEEELRQAGGSNWGATLVCERWDEFQRELGENDARAFQTLDVAYTLTIGGTPSLPGNAPMPDGAGLVRLTVDLTIRSVSEPSIRDKLLRLDPNYRTNPAYGEGVTWVEANAFTSDASGEETTVGMIAAFDYTAGQLGNSLSDKLKTRSVLGLQPLLFHQESRAVQVAGSSHELLYLPQAAAYFVERSAPPDVPALIASAGVTEGQGIIRSVLAKASARQITLMTVYGIHQAHDSSTKTLLNNLSRGALAAAARGGISRKVVLFASCKLDLDGMLEVPHARVVSIGAADAQTQLDALGDDELLVLHSKPSVPSPVFQLLIQESHLPVVLEGANTANQVQMLCKPYVSVSAKYTPYVPVPGDRSRSDAALTEITGHLNGDLARSAGALESVAAYFHAAATGGDAFDGYFAKLRAYVRTDARDQTKLGLYRLAKALAPQPPPPVAAPCAANRRDT